MTQTYTALSDLEALERLVNAIKLRANVGLLWDGKSWSVVLTWIN